jgi:hypothetical protein
MTEKADSPVDFGPEQHSELHYWRKAIYRRRPPTVWSWTVEAIDEGEQTLEVVHYAILPVATNPFSSASQVMSKRS